MPPTTKAILIALAQRYRFNRRRFRAHLARQPHMNPYMYSYMFNAINSEMLESWNIFQEAKLYGYGQETYFQKL